MRLAYQAARRFGFLALFGFAVLAGPTAAEVVDAELTLGGRGISGDTHSGKFEEYRDLRPGAFGGGHFLVESENERVFLWGAGENVGYDDQRYGLEFGEWGKFRLFGEYSELPHVFSTQSRTLYTYSGSNRLMFPDAFQTGNPADLEAGLATARRTSLEYRLRTIVGGLVFDPREDLQFETAYRQLDRSGRKPFNMAFGSPGGNFTSFASPVDEKTHEATADLRWGRGPFNLEVGYLGSFFENDLNQVTVENPLTTLDLASASSQGRTSLAPDNSLNQFHLTSTYDLPVEIPARLATTFSYGLRLQDEDFLPHTINPVIAADPSLVLPQDDLDGEVHTYLANALLTARPLPELDLRTRYRYYRLDNDSDVIEFPGHAVNDRSPSAEIRRNVPNEYERQEASFDASYRFSRELRIRGGPFWEQWSRSSDREVSRLDEWGAKLAMDLRPTRRVLVRADYLFGTRNGSGYDAYDYLDATLDPADVPGAIATGQLAELRKYDEADRTRNEVKLLVQWMLRRDLDVSVSGGWAHYDYRNTDYGTEGQQRWNVGTEFAYQPLEWLSFSAWYNFERAWLDQRSRYRPVAGGVATDDPANDWSSESVDTIHTLGAQLGFILVPDKLDLDLSYVFERGNGKTHSRSAPGGAAAGEASNFPDIKDRLQLLTTTLRYHCNENLSIAGTYAFEKLSLSDYRVDGLDPYMPASSDLDVFLGNRLGDYSAHIFALSATYRY